MLRVLLGLALVLIALPASAQTAEEWSRCLADGSKIPAEARVGYCTQLIQSGRLLTQNVRAAYWNRGVAYGTIGQYDKAISDYTQAIALQPTGAAYALRGYTYERKGARDQAIADYRTALRLSPDLDFAKQALTKLGVSP